MDHTVPGKEAEDKCIYYIYKIYLKKTDTAKTIIYNTVKSIIVYK